MYAPVSAGVDAAVSAGLGAAVSDGLKLQKREVPYD